MDVLNPEMDTVKHVPIPDPTEDGRAAPGGRNREAYATVIVQSRGAENLSSRAHAAEEATVSQCASTAKAAAQREKGPQDKIVTSDNFPFDFKTF